MKADVVPYPRTEDGSPTLQEFSRFVDRIYAGPLESPPWKSFLDLLKVHMGCSYATLILRPASPQRASLMVVAGPTTVENISLYDSRYFTVDPLVNLPHGEAIVASEILGDQAWLDSVFYREYLKPIGILHLLGADLQPSEKGEDCRLRVTRSHFQPPFGEPDKVFFKLLLPHLQRAVHLYAHMDQLDIQRELFATTIERLQVGTVMLDEKGSLLSVNGEAQAVLDQKDGIRLVAGALKADYAQENQLLQHLIAVAIKGQTPEGPAVVEAVAITRPSGGSKLSVLVRVIPAGVWSDAWSRPKIAIFLRDPDQRSQGSIEVVQRLFDLTHAEALLALLLANGLTLDEAAEQLNIRRNTARAHLRAIFSKTYVTRQTKLVRLILNSVAPLS